MPRKGAARPIPSLRKAARGCRACDLWKPATQTVFGEGPEDARIMLVGEQAGDQEDREGHPFVGPAGKLLDQVLAEIGIDRGSLYVTNVVKHFKFELRGKRRLHKSADAAEIAACLQWLDAELERIRPHYVVCLGAVAAKVILGSAFRLMRDRGQWMRAGENRWAFATVHPAFVLRARIGGGGEAALAEFRRDLALLINLPVD